MFEEIDELFGKTSSDQYRLFNSFDALTNEYWQEVFIFSLSVGSVKTTYVVAANKIQFKWSCNV